MSESETFGSWLQRRRRNLDLTQQALADCAGCSIVTIRKFESDERRPSKQLAELLADCLAVPAEQRETFITFARHPLTADPLPPPLPAIDAPPLAIPSPPNLLISQSPVSTLQPPIFNLPSPLTALFGREQEIMTVLRLLMQPGTRLVTLTGPGGTGKTRLALEVGHSLQRTQPELFPDGIAFVDLASINLPELVIPTIIEALGLKDSEEGASLAALQTYLRPRQLLLILDNFEQVVSAGEQLLLLLQTAPGLCLLVTSRTLLHLYGEQEFPVPPLPLPHLEQLPRARRPAMAALLENPAVALFVARSQAVRPGFQLTAENALPIIDICRRLDGLPLAIELAAARSKILAPAALLSQLRKSLDLTSQQRHISERQRTLRGAIEWSYNLLGEAEQALFARLGVFAGEFTAEAAAAVAIEGEQAAEPLIADEEDLNAPVLDQLLALVDQSMLTQQTSQKLVQQGGGQGDLLPRFRLLLTLREFALEQLAKLGELETIRTRHAAYYHALARYAAPKVTGPQQTLWLQRLEAAHDNLRATLAWSLESAERHQVALEMVTALSDFWKVRSHLTEGRRWAAQVLAQSETAVSSPALAEAYFSAGKLALYQEEYQEAETLLKESLQQWQALGAGDEQLARLYRLLGAATFEQERFELAQQHLEQVLAIYERLGRPQDIAGALHNLGLNVQRQGRYEEALAYLEKSLPLMRKAGDLWGIHLILNSLGNTAVELGRFSLARTWLQESVAIARELGDRSGLAMALSNSGAAELYDGRLETAQAFYRECVATADERGSQITIAFARHGLGVMELLRNQPPDVVWEQISQPFLVWKQIPTKRLIMRGIDTVALFLARYGRAAEAVQLQGQAERLRETFPLPPRSLTAQPFYEQMMELARQQLDEAVFAQAWADGRALSLEEAVELALRTGEAIVTAHGQHDQRLMVHDSPQALPPSDTLQSPLSNLLFSESRYRLGRHLATGGMGEVYLGEDTTTGEMVVIKRLRPDLLSSHPEAVERFIREGELLRRLNHPNIVKMLDSGETDGRRFIVMEYVSGGTLRDLLQQQQRLEPYRVIELGLELADALARAHHLGIIHRDLKPENVLLAADGTPRLTDFGLAYQRQYTPRLTEPGILIGTVAYMSPEAHRGEDLDAAGDIWSLGIILYEMLSGSHPFQRPTLSDTLLAILNEPLPALTAAGPGKITVPLVALLERMLVKDRRERLGSARQVAAELEKML